MAPWRRWLARLPVTQEVAGSIPAGVVSTDAWGEASYLFRIKTKT